MGDVVSAMCNAGADVNWCVPQAGDSEGHQSALHEAAAAGNVRCTRVMIQNGANMHLTYDLEGEKTPLVAALSSQQYGTARLLISMGGRTPRNTQSYPQRISDDSMGMVGMALRETGQGEDVNEYMMNERKAGTPHRNKACAECGAYGRKIDKSGKFYCSRKCWIDHGSGK